MGSLILTLHALLSLITDCVRRRWKPSLSKLWVGNQRRKTRNVSYWQYILKLVISISFAPLMIILRSSMPRTSKPNSNSYYSLQLSRRIRCKCPLVISCVIEIDPIRSTFDSLDLNQTLYPDSSKVTCKKSFGCAGRRRRFGPLSILGRLLPLLRGTGLRLFLRPAQPQNQVETGSGGLLCKQQLIIRTAQEREQVNICLMEVVFSFMHQHRLATLVCLVIMLLWVQVRVWPLALIWRRAFECMRERERMSDTVSNHWICIFRVNGKDLRTIQNNVL